MGHQALLLMNLVDTSVVAAFVVNVAEKLVIGCDRQALEIDSAVDVEKTEGCKCVVRAVVEVGVDPRFAVAAVAEHSSESKDSLVKLVKLTQHCVSQMTV